MYARQQIKQEPMHGLPVAVKTEPKPEPVDTYSTPSLADLDGITDLLPMQTGERILVKTSDSRWHHLL